MAQILGWFSVPRIRASRANRANRLRSLVNAASKTLIATSRELAVVRTVHFAHPARAEQRVQAIPAERLAGHVRQRVRHARGEVCRRCRIIKAVRESRRLTTRSGGIRLAPERLVLPDRLRRETPNARPARPFVGRVIQLLDPLPAFRRHGRAATGNLAAILAPFTPSSWRRRFPLPGWGNTQ